jgi:hypothetical protein
MMFPHYHERCIGVLCSRQHFYLVLDEAQQTSHSRTDACLGPSRQAGEFDLLPVDVRQGPRRTWPESAVHRKGDRIHGNFVFGGQL